MERAVKRCDKERGCRRDKNDAYPELRVNLEKQSMRRSKIETESGNWNRTIARVLWRGNVTGGNRGACVGECSCTKERKIRRCCRELNKSEGEVVAFLWKWPLAWSDFLYRLRWFKSCELNFFIGLREVGHERREWSPGIPELARAQSVTHSRAGTCAAKNMYYYLGRIPPRNVSSVISGAFGLLLHNQNKWSLYAMGLFRNTATAFSSTFIRSLQLRSNFCFSGQLHPPTHTRELPPVPISLHNSLTVLSFCFSRSKLVSYLLFALFSPCSHHSGFDQIFNCSPTSLTIVSPYRSLSLSNVAILLSRQKTASVSFTFSSYLTFEILPPNDFRFYALHRILQTAHLFTIILRTTLPPNHQTLPRYDTFFFSYGPGPFSA